MCLPQANRVERAWDARKAEAMNGYIRLPRAFWSRLR